ncbi:hypothetical protein X777_13097, partial [Ooceraea biroi]
VHRPSAFSPQKCTLRKGHSSKLELRTSRGRSNNRVDVVPIGEVSSSLKFPRGKNLKETCFTTKNRTSFKEPAHPVTSIYTLKVYPYVGSIGLSSLISSDLHICWGGTLVHCSAKLTMAPASIR